MRISPLNQYYKNSTLYSANSRTSQKENTYTSNQKITQSLYKKGIGHISFGETLIQDYLYDKSLDKHIHLAKDINPKDVEDYFYKLGVPCTIRQGSSKTQKVIAYCCFNAAEIFRQINHPSVVLPLKIDMEEMPALAPGLYPIAGCYPGPVYEKGYPVRTVVFNSLYDWDNHMEKSKEIQKLDGGFHSSGHFLQTFIHEFGHNVHNHHLYSKYGSPFPSEQYVYNPQVANILQALNMKIYDEKGNVVYNPYVPEQTRLVMKKSSGYGSTLLPETFAEEFARAIINCMNPMNLRLTKDPFPIMTANPELNAVLYETWEGLVADGKGYVK
mgnify:CR=1 FL=1